jgi:L-threonylcarbamoyladenylate synthase
MPILKDIHQAVELLKTGAVVGLPTETVYGLGGHALNPLAIRQIYATKGRPAGHPVIVHVGAKADWSAWGEMNAQAVALADRFWPGPLTLIMPKRPRVPSEVTGGLHSVGIRVPKHPMFQQVLSEFGSGIAAPSANRFGRISPTTAQHVVSEFGDDIPVLDGGPCDIGIESTIIDVTGDRPALLRPGYISQTDIEAVVGSLGTSNTPAPGTLKSHYAPMTSLHLSLDVDADRARFESKGLTVAVLNASDPKSYAHRLYAELRRLDQLGVDVLIAEESENSGMGLAINDRLHRAKSTFSTGE